MDRWAPPRRYYTSPALDPLHPSYGRPADFAATMSGRLRPPAGQLHVPEGDLRALLNRGRAEAHGHGDAMTERPRLGEAASSTLVSCLAPWTVFS